MIYSLRGAMFAVVGVVGISGYAAIDRTANYKAATATVSYIDRNCDIVTTVYDANDKAQSSSTRRGACNSIVEWEKVKTKRTKDVSGDAVVHLSYTAPQTGQTASGEIRFTGRDDEFYKLKAGDEVKILVSNSDPTKIRKA